MSLNREELEEIQMAVEGLLDEEEWEAFQRRVVEDAAYRRAYVEKQSLHAELLARGSGLPSLFEGAPAVSERSVAWRFTAGVAGVAAALAVALTWFAAKQQYQSEEVLVPHFNPRMVPSHFAERR